MVFDKMFSPAGHKTFGARAIEVLATVALMWFSMLFVVTFFKIILPDSVDYATSIPAMGVSLNWWLDSQNLTLGHAFSSVLGVLGVLGIIMFAPLLEEPLFRGLPCSVASDNNGELRPRWGIFVVIVVSFILFGLAHGHGYFSVMLQGVGGLFLARLFFRNGPNTRTSLLSGMAAHSLYNISVVIVTWFASS